MTGRAPSTPALRDDPRIDPRLVAAVEPFGLADPLPPSRLTAEVPLEDIRSALDRIEAGSAHMMAAGVAGLRPVQGVECSTETIAGPDGNEITLYLHRPVEPPERGPGPATLPGVLHLHGGGCVMMSAADVNYVRWRDELAARGLVVVGVEFRNGAGALGPHPFPAGLDDSIAALEWMHQGRQALGLSAIVVSGDSGGANLALATTIRAAREGHIEQIDGTYALCPYISGAYSDPPPELASLRDNDGLLVSVSMMGAMAKAYTPEPADLHDPLAWPYHATGEDLRGLPPHVISLNELDPLRDEGLAYYRKLLAAGVPTRARTVLGTFHAAENNYFGSIPDVARSTLADVVEFATACAGGHR